MPVVPHVSAAWDYKWLSPPRVEFEAPEAPERRGAPVVSVRGTAAAITRQTLEAVLRRVAPTTRAMDRASTASVLLEATRRALSSGLVPVPEALASEVAEAAARREERAERAVERRSSQVATSVETWLRSEASRSEASPVAQAESRGSLGSSSPGSRSARRAYAGMPGMSVGTLDHVAERGASERSQRRLGSQRTRPGRVSAPSGTVLSPAVRGSEEPTSGRATVGNRARRALRRGERPESGAGRMPTQLWQASGYGLGLMSLPGSEAAEAGIAARVASSLSARSLGSTLETLATRSERGERGAAVVRSGLVQSEGTQQVLSGGSSVQTSAAVGQGTPGWAQRAVTGATVTRVPGEVAEGREREALRAYSGGRQGDLVRALARTQSAEEVVNVILDRGKTVRSALRDLPTPALRMMERAVESREASVQRRSLTPTVEQEVLSAQRVSAEELKELRSGSPKVYSGAQTLPRTGGDGGRSREGWQHRSDVNATKIAKLSQKLMNLVHLAERDRKTQEEASRLRKAAADSHARSEGRESLGVQMAAEDEDRVKVLYEDVLQHVLRQMHLQKMRQPDSAPGGFSHFEG